MPSNTQRQYLNIMGVFGQIGATNLVWAYCKVSKSTNGLPTSVVDFAIGSLQRRQLMTKSAQRVVEKTEKNTVPGLRTIFVKLSLVICVYLKPVRWWYSFSIVKYIFGIFWQIHGTLFSQLTAIMCCFCIMVPYGFHRLLFRYRSVRVLLGFKP